VDSSREAHATIGGVDVKLREDVARKEWFDNV